MSVWTARRFTVDETSICFSSILMILFAWFYFFLSMIMDWNLCQFKIILLTTIRHNQKSSIGLLIFLSFGLNKHVVYCSKGRIWKEILWSFVEFSNSFEKQFKIYLILSIVTAETRVKLATGGQPPSAAKNIINKL